MSIKYLKAIQLQKLTDKELDQYSYDMMNEQIDILDLIDIWTDHYNLVSDEYDRRRGKRSTVIKNDSSTLH